MRVTVLSSFGKRDGDDRTMGSDAEPMPQDGPGDAWRHVLRPGDELYGIGNDVFVIGASGGDLDPSRTAGGESIGA